MDANGTQNDWTVALSHAAELLERGQLTRSFLTAFGALESCFRSAVPNAGHNRNFADIAEQLRSTGRIKGALYHQADHLRTARNVVAHTDGFEPSHEECRRCIDRVRKICSHFATKVHDVMVKPVITTTLDAPLRPCVQQMRDHGISQFPIVDTNGRMIGTLFEKAVLEAMLQGEGIVDLDMPVSQCASTILLPTIGASSTVGEARTQLSREGTAALVVVAAGQPTGIVTRFDVIGL